VTAATSDEISERVVMGCPSTFDATNGQRCGHESVVCTLPIACPTFDQQSTCTCTHGRFACNDRVGTLAVGTVPRCLAMDEASTETCAATLEESRGASCEILGHSCAYLGAVCPDRPVQNTDTCTCLRDGTSGELVMKCRVAECSLLGAPQEP
jgi:hypothetical protein